MKGHVTIELYNHNSGVTSRFEQDNMVTNALTYAMGHAASCGANLNDLMLPVAKRGLGGLFLFDGKLEENVENIHFPMNVHLVGHASRAENLSDVMHGSLNSVETKRTDTGYVSVWDFSTSQANGTIASLALTRNTAGESPLKLYDGESGSTTDYEYGFAFDEENGYVYKADRYGNVIRQKVPGCKMLVSDPYWGPDEKVTNLTGTNGWDNWIISNGQDGYLYLIRMNRQDNTRWNGDTYEHYYTYGYGNSSGNALMFVRKFKISDFSFEQEGDEQTIELASVTATNDAVVSRGYYYVRGYDNHSVYKIEMANPVNIVLLNQFKSYDVGGLYPMYNGGIITSGGLLIYSDGQYFKKDSVAIPDYGYESPTMFSFHYNSYPKKSIPSNYIGTICNLSSPITKTSATSMKVTYTLTDLKEA
jgi:hypothetical protein